MKKLTILVINFYQAFISGAIHQLTGIKNGCRFEVTCSEYTKQSIIEKGILKGGYLSLIRLFKCQPFYTGI